MASVLGNFLCLAFVLSPSCLISGQAYELKANQRFPYHADLNETYSLSWDFNVTHIIFKIRVMTTGSVGLAIANDTASDVLIAWVDDNGKAHISDRHDATKRIKDLSQDWKLLEGFERNGHTIITVMRLLDTGDKAGDVSILDGTTKVLFAYNKNDLKSDDSNLYDVHTKISQKYMLLLNPVASHRMDPFTDAVSQQFTIPAGAVLNKCSLHQFSDLREKHHIIKFEADLDQGKEKFIRNVALYACSQSQSLTRADDQVFDCAGSQEEQQCFDPILVWGSGGTRFDLPNHVGLPVANSSQRYMLSVFYTNEGSSHDVAVRAGFKMEMTNRLRMYDAGIFLVGRMQDKFLTIPPHQKQFVIQGVCHSECLKQGMKGPIHVVAAVPHAHSLARGVVTRHFRGNKELDPIQKDMSFTRDFQENRMLKQERTVKPEDTLATKCFFDSRTRSNITTGGFDTSEEMCMSYLMYYPKSDLVICASSLDTTPNKLSGYTAGVNWTNEMESKKAIWRLDQMNLTTLCLGTETNLIGMQFFPL